MSGKAAFDNKLDELRSLRSDPRSSAAQAALRKALRHRGNFIVSKAAAIVEECQLSDMAPDLLAAYHRFFDDGARTDPQCWAKNAIAKALLALDHDGPEAFVKGVSYKQPEPSWGGSEDSAATLRATCVLGLAQSRLPAFDVLEYLVAAFADEARPVRVEVARAIGLVGKAEGALLLRLKVQLGDRDMEVIGACFSSLLHLQRAHGVPFVARYLAGGELRGEAAAALGESREQAAFDALREAWERTGERRFRQALLTAIGASRTDHSIGFLLSLIQPRSMDACDAIAALAPHVFHAETRRRIEDAVQATGDEALMDQLRRLIEARS